MGYNMGYKLPIWLAGVGAALMIAAPIGAQAQSGRSGLRVVAPVLTKHSAGRSIDNVRSGMKQETGPGSKDAAENAAENAAKTGAKTLQKTDADAKAVGGK